MNPPLDDASARRRRTGLAFAVIDLERVLKIAQGAIDLLMISQRRTASGNRLSQHVPDFVAQADKFGAGPPCRRYERACDPIRRQAGPVKGFADIDVAKPGYFRLIQEK